MAITNNNLKPVLQGQIQALSQRITAKTGSLEDRVSDLEDLAAALFYLTNSIIANIEERND